MTKLVETVQPTVDFSYHKYCQAHDVVVASEAYNRALETASAIIHKARARPPDACGCCESCHATARCLPSAALRVQLFVAHVVWGFLQHTVGERLCMVDIC